MTGSGPRLDDDATASLGSGQIRWNDDVRLVFSDVDETIAPLHGSASPETLAHLSSYLRDGGKVCFVTGNSSQRVVSGITDLIAPGLRSSVLIAGMSGVELWGFTPAGLLRDEPFISHYERLLGGDLEVRMGEVADRLVAEFDLRIHPPQSAEQLRAEVGDDPLDVVYAHRRVEISIEFVNERQGEGLRAAVFERAEELLVDARLPVTLRMSGSLGVDITVEGVSKANAVRELLGSSELLASVGLSAADVSSAESLEIWGDDFDATVSGIDLRMSEAVSPSVRSICFRDVDPGLLPADRNIVLWDGAHRLENGLLEYLRSR